MQSEASAVELSAGEASPQLLGVEPCLSQHPQLVRPALHLVHAGLAPRQALGLPLPRRRRRARRRFHRLLADGKALLEVEHDAAEGGHVLPPGALGVGLELLPRQPLPAARKRALDDSAGAVVAGVLVEGAAGQVSAAAAEGAGHRPRGALGLLVGGGEGERHGDGTEGARHEPPLARRHVSRQVAAPQCPRRCRWRCLRGRSQLLLLLLF